jgi:hypothetical protein
MIFSAAGELKVKVSIDIMMRLVVGFLPLIVGSNVGLACFCGPLLLPVGVHRTQISALVILIVKHWGCSLSSEC